jgi:hypothetical protein
MPPQRQPSIDTLAAPPFPQVSYAVNPYEPVPREPVWIDYLGDLLNSDTAVIRSLAKTTLRFGSVNNAALPSGAYPPVTGSDFPTYIADGKAYGLLDIIRETYLEQDDLRLVLDPVTEALLANDQVYHDLAQETEPSAKESTVPIDQERVFRLWFFMRRVIDYREAGGRAPIFYTT